MPYASGRIIHDADSHLMELPDSLEPFIDVKFLAAYRDLPKVRKAREAAYGEQARVRQADETFRDGADANIMLRKNYDALGAFLKADRPRALDQLGFASQLVFTTWCLNNFGLEKPDEAPLGYATAQAHGADELVPSLALPATSSTCDANLQHCGAKQLAKSMAIH